MRVVVAGGRAAHDDAVDEDARRPDDDAVAPDVFRPGGNAGAVRHVRAAQHDDVLANGREHLAAGDDDVGFGRRLGGGEGEDAGADGDLVPRNRHALAADDERLGPVQRHRHRLAADDDLRA